jgi:molybdopterin molybdotransferase
MSHDHHQPVTWDEARRRARAAVTGAQTPQGVRKKPEPGDVLATDAPAPMDVPHYTSSAMDGFAVRGDGPWRLLAAPFTGSQGRNVHRTGGSLADGEALPVLTGSLLPDGAESVVRSENTEVKGDVLHAERPAPGRDIRPSGQEWRVGDTLLPAGTRLTPRHVAMLGAAGVDDITAARAPKVACAFTGNEVVASGVPGPGEVRDAFSVSFPALLTGWGARVVTAGHLADDPVAVEDWLRRPEVLDADIVVMTGGSGRSGQDFARRFITRAALASGAGGEILADEVACQPGHPTLLVRRIISGRPQLIVGAPGNPFAAHVALHSFVAPAVAAALGLESPVFSGTVGGPVEAMRRDRVRLMPAVFGEDTALTVLPGRLSHMLSGYAAADALVVVPREGLAAGDGVPYLPL